MQGKVKHQMIGCCIPAIIMSEMKEDGVREVSQLTNKPNDLF